VFFFFYFFFFFFFLGGCSRRTTTRTTAIHLQTCSTCRGATLGIFCSPRACATESSSCFLGPPSRLIRSVHLVEIQANNANITSQQCQYSHRISHAFSRDGHIGTATATRQQISCFSG
jgi:hypothetical protein